MDDRLKSLAMVDVAEHILRDNKEPLVINELLDKVLSVKEYPLDDVDKKNQLYMDITQSGKFVYSGNDTWDLKERNLELWDKDGYAFITHGVEEEVDDDLDFTEFVLDDIREELLAVEGVDEDEDIVYDEEMLEEAEYLEVELPIISTDEDDFDEPEIEFDSDDYDEDDYNDIMDDYEDMYEDD